MGTLGKLLLFVNLLVAAGLVYLTSQDWAVRQSIQANVLRHHLVLAGMPVEPPVGIDSDDDNIALGTVVSGQIVVERVRLKFLKEHFTGTDGEELAGVPVVKSQMAEVTGIKAKMEAKLGGLAPAEKLAQLCGRFDRSPQTQRLVFTPGILTLMTESFVERDLLRQMVDPDRLATRGLQRVEENATIAMAMLNKRFDALTKVDPAQSEADAGKVKQATEAIRQASDAAKSKFAAYKAFQDDKTSDPKTVAAAAKEATDAFDKLGDTHTALQTVLSSVGTDACRDESDRRNRIAHLLMHLSETAGWQKRVALVVGLRTYAHVMADQVDRFAKMERSTEQQIGQDQGRFAEEYELLKNLAIGRALLLQQQVVVRSELELQRANDIEAVTQRRLLTDDRRKGLEDIQAKVAAGLDAQSKVEQRLFAIEKQVGETLRKNFGLEGQLEATENKGGK